jgi:hypothetical protein
MGLTSKEIRLASEAAHYLAGLRLPLFFATVANHDEPERVSRDRFRNFKNIVAKEQKRAGIKSCLWLEVLEGQQSVHSHILFPLKGRNAREIAERMRASTQFPGDTLHIRPADSAQQFVAYCSKERTPQAKFIPGLRLARRLPGSHPLGDGGGDRVRLSRALTGALVAAGKTIQHRRDYADRALPVTPITPEMQWPLDTFIPCLSG